MAWARVLAPEMVSPPTMPSSYLPGVCQGWGEPKRTGCSKPEGKEEFRKGKWPHPLLLKEIIRGPADLSGNLLEMWNFRPQFRSTESGPVFNHDPQMTCVHSKV